MQATLQEQYEPLALMPAPHQQMQRQQQQQQQPAVYHQLALMPPPQRMQPDFASMQRQALPWQQQQQLQQQQQVQQRLQQQLQRQPMRQQQLLQLPYTTHNNPAAQQGDEQVSACSDLASCIYFVVTWFA